MHRTPPSVDNSPSENKRILFFLAFRCEKGSARNVLPCLDLVILGHGASEFLIELLQGGHVRKGGAQKIAAQRLVANITDVVFTEKKTSAKIIDPLHGGDTEALDAPQKILEGY